VTQLAKQLNLALNEARILVLGNQVLVALAFRTTFEPRFADLRLADQLIALTALGFLLLTLATTMTPAARHQIVERGKPTPHLLRHVTRLVGLALLPLALAMGLATYVVALALLPPRAAAPTGAAVALVACFAWYGLGLLRRRPHPPPEENDMTREPHPSAPPNNLEPDKLEEQITVALTEVRVVLPGAQALLGFQAAIMFTEAFARLPDALKYAHLLSLLLILLTVMLLMTPAAYHRIAERGGFSPHLHRFITRTLVAAMITLALGMGVELYVVAHKITRSQPLAAAIAAAMLAVYYGLWFGYTLWARHRVRSSERLS
jgi:hypothetical protein